MRSMTWPARLELHDLRMSRDRRAERAVGREEDVAAGEKRSRAAGAAEDAIQRADDRRRRRIDLELRPARRVRHRHHQAGRHPVARRVAEQDRQRDRPAAARNRKVAADRVRDVIERRDLVRRRARRVLRDQIGLQVARELQLVAELDLVDQLHREQHHHDHERRPELHEQPGSMCGIEWLKTVKRQRKNQTVVATKTSRRTGESRFVRPYAIALAVRIQRRKAARLLIDRLAMLRHQRRRVSVQSRL